jgi:ppGpp synthetase/RelA/SpoT-type nucleotidyltranferase
MVSVDDIPDGKRTLALNHPEATLRLLLLAAEQIVQRLRILTGTMGPSSQSAQFYTRARAKTADSIRGKILRNQQGHNRQKERLPSYSFRQLTDTVGFRVVTLYDADLPSAMQYILDMVFAGQNLSDPLFKPEFVWSSFVEALFIKRTRDKLDPYADCLIRLRERITPDYNRSHRRRELPAVLKKCREDIRDKDGYSSAHIIFNARGYVGDVIIEVPVEFQFRTAVEDIWAEIDHKFIYKINTSSTWSHDYQLSYDKARGASRALKEDINKFPDQIYNFYTAYQQAVQDLTRLWTQNPNHRYHFSLVTSLIIAMGDRQLSTFSYRLDLYKRAVDQLNAAHQGGDREIARARIAVALSELRGVMENIDAADVPASPTAEADQLLNQERRALCQLEIFRLKTLLILYCDGIEADDGKIEFIDKDAGGPKVHQSLMSLYGEFCRYLERPLAMMPRCMILFFKYLLANEFDVVLKASLAKANLIQSYELLESNSDRTIPEWSIYRVLLPRALAEHELSEVRVICNQMGPDIIELSSMNTLKKELEQKLVDALKFSLRAAREHLKGRNKAAAMFERRGDIIFGVSPNEAIKDLQLITDICTEYRDNFDSMQKHDKLKHNLLPQEKEEVLLCLTELMKPSVNGSNVEVNDPLKTKVEKILKALAVPSRQTTERSDHEDVQSTPKPRARRKQGSAAKGDGSAAAAGSC